ncbi:uncharacterized protein LOC135686653 [Rhopilema esculentum]|uniref:uncharacterized protein LOC135686653 n=1 Tax=Rhopilema esculentum TaxID=499914 RepID=UPI0031D525F3|eukprot:gene899-10654_t
MAKTTAERVREHRKRLKELNVDKWKQEKEKDRKRKADKRAALKTNNPERYQEVKNEEAKRIRKYRAKLKMLATAHVAEEQPALFANRQSFGKAVKKVKSKLPESPRKRKAVLAKLAEDAGISFTGSPPSKSKKPGPKENTEIDAAAIAFYSNDDISWQAPGRKDRVIYRSRDANGKKHKEYVQCRYMLMSLGEAHQLAVTTGLMISRSKFCSLRPKHIKLMEDRPHNVCVCVTHENMRMLLQALKPHINVPSCQTKFTSELVCDPTSKNCMSLKCDDCSKNLESFKPNGESADLLVKYPQWQGASSELSKISVSETVESAFSELKRQLPAYLIHVYIKRQQKTFFEKKKSNVDGKSCVLHVDFSENALLRDQDEPQSAHWTHNQAGLFTAYFWRTQVSGESHIIVTDDVNHTKDQVWTFITTLLEDFTGRHLDIETIDIFSDGTSTQFKQRYLFSNLSKWESTFGIKVNWHFFATSHGKGVIDGIGGTVKRSVWRAVRSGNARASKPYDFYQLAVERNPNVKFHFVSAETVQLRAKEIQPYWDQVLRIIGTRSVHTVSCRGDSTVLVAEVSTAKEFQAHVFLDVSDSESSDDDSVDDFADSSPECKDEEQSQPGENCSITTGDFVVVQYESERNSRKNYIAQVIEIDNEADLHKVINMRRCGESNKFVFIPKDKCWVEKNQIKAKLEQPNFDQRQRYTFEKIPDIL